MLSAISSVEELTVVEPVITAEQVPTEHSSLDVGSSVEKQSPVAERHEAKKKSPIEKQVCEKRTPTNRTSQTRETTKF